MEEVGISPTSAFVSHGCVQRAGSEQRGKQCIRYRSYLSPKSLDLPDALSFAYGASLTLSSKKVALCLERDLDQQESDSCGDRLMGGRSNLDWYSSESESELSSCMPAMGNVPKADYSIQ